jgi:rod shape-determining protein MreD
MSMSINRVPVSAGLLLLVFLFQEAFVNRINFFLGGFALYLSFTIAWILREERTSAVLIGFLAGLIADLSPTLEAPFGLWTFTLTGLAFLIVTYVRGSLDSNLSPLTLSLVTTIFSTFALMLFIIFGAILGQDLPSLSVLAREMIGNALWSFVLAPLYIPVAIRTHKLSLSARER